MLVFLQTLEGWVYMDPIHGPLDGPLYMGSIYSNKWKGGSLVHVLQNWKKYAYAYGVTSPHTLFA